MFVRGGGGHLGEAIFLMVVLMASISFSIMPGQCAVNRHLQC